MRYSFLAHTHTNTFSILVQAHSYHQHCIWLRHLPNSRQFTNRFESSAAAKQSLFSQEMVENKTKLKGSSVQSCIRQLTRNMITNKYLYFDHCWVYIAASVSNNNTVLTKLSQTIRILRTSPGEPNTFWRANKWCFNAYDNFLVRMFHQFLCAMMSHSV